MLNFSSSSDVSIAIDLGTENFLVSNRNQILFRESTIAALPVTENERCGKIIIGNLAKTISHTHNSQYKIIRPLQRGVICDFDNCKHLIEFSLKHASKRFFKKPGILMTHPLDITTVEKNAFREVLKNLGYTHIQLISEPLAVAAGLVKNFETKKGVVIVDVGAGITEAVVFSLGGIVSNSSLRIGGNNFEQAVIKYIKKYFNFVIGNKTALNLLKLIGENHPDKYLQPLIIKGTHLLHRLPGTLNLEMQDLLHVLDNYFNQIADMTVKSLEKAPAELSSEILDNGIYLTGGASQYRRLIEILESKIGIKVQVDLQPLLGVARGQIALLQKPRS